MADPTPVPTPTPAEPWILRVYHSDFVQAALDAIGKLVGAHPQQGHVSPIDLLRACIVAIVIWTAANSGLLHLNPDASAGVSFALMTIASWLGGSKPMNNPPPAS